MDLRNTFEAQDIQPESLGCLLPVFCEESAPESTLVALEQSHAQKVAFCREQIMREMPQPSTAVAMAAVLSIINSADIDTRLARGDSVDAVASDVVSRCQKVASAEEEIAEVQQKKAHKDNDETKKKKEKAEATASRTTYTVHDIQGMTRAEFAANKAAFDAQMEAFMSNAGTEGVVFVPEMGMWAITNETGTIWVESSAMTNLQVFERDVNGRVVFDIVRRSAPTLTTDGMVTFDETAFATHRFHPELFGLDAAAILALAEDPERLEKLRAESAALDATELMLKDAAAEAKALGTVIAGKAETVVTAVMDPLSILRGRNIADIAKDPDVVKACDALGRQCSAVEDVTANDVMLTANDAAGAKVPAASTDLRI